MKAIIVDDEPRARTALKNQLGKYCSEVLLVGEAEDVKSGLQAIKQYKPQLVFLDVEMPDGDGFDLLEQCKGAAFNVIFTTAHEEYAMRAFRFSAIDYLQKPIDPLLLKEAVQKAIENSTEHELSKKVEALIGIRAGEEKLAVPTSDGLRLIRINDILRLKSDRNYTTIFLSAGEKMLVTRTLKEYDEMLSSCGFQRVHQSHLLNMKRVERFINRDSGYAVMEDGSQVEISRRKKDEFMAALLNR
jgi:two-component system LytT family response regulator